MINKFKVFTESFYSNKSILEAKKFSLITIIILFFMIISMVNFPFMLTRVTITPEQIIEYFPNVEQVFIDLVNSDANCRVNDEFKFTCDQDVMFSKGDYIVNMFSNEIHETSYITFMNDSFELHYIADKEEDNRSVYGDYSLLGGLNFEEIKEKNDEQLTEVEYYKEVAATIIHSIHQSTATTQYTMTYMLQLFQNLIFVLVISGLFLFSNKKNGENKLNYIDSLKVVVVSGVAVSMYIALFALFGIFKAETVTYFFSVAFSIRIVFVYLSRFKAKKDKDKDLLMQF